MSSGYPAGTIASFDKLSGWHAEGSLTIHIGTLEERARSTVRFSFGEKHDRNEDLELGPDRNDETRQRWWYDGGGTGAKSRGTLTTVEVIQATLEIDQ